MIYKFLRFCFLFPIIVLNIHFLSKRIVNECIGTVNYYGTYEFYDFYWMNYLIIYNYEELFYKLKKEFQYYLFSSIFEKIEFSFVNLLFFQKECTETFIKYLYFMCWGFYEIITLLYL